MFAAVNIEPPIKHIIIKIILSPIESSFAAGAYYINTSSDINDQRIIIPILP